MSRWTLRSGAAGVIVVLALALAGALFAMRHGDDAVSSKPAKPAAKFERDAPNVVVVMTDDQAVDTMGAMPHTRRIIGGKGVTFENSFVSYPLCCPSRATFQTGQYSHNNGVLDNHPPKGGYQAFNNERALPVWMSRAGYSTGFVGKYLNGYGKGENATEVPPGWSDWYGMPARSKQVAYDFQINENGKLVSYKNGEYKTDVLEDEALSVLKGWSDSDRPFFLWVATDAPHKDKNPAPDADRDPEPAPRDHGKYEDAKAPRGPSFNERDVSDKPGLVKGKNRLSSKQHAEIDKIYKSQLESLRSVDRLVRSITRELRRQGELDNTVIMFTSDNGFLRGQHRIDSGKASVYEESIRVPLLVRGPGFPSGDTDDRIVGNIDLAPTILDLAGAEPSIDPDGTSLLPFEDTREDWRPYLLLEVLGRGRNFVGVRTPEFAYARYEKKNEDGENKRELYDVNEDPMQLENLARDPEYADELERLDQLVDELENCAGAECG